MVRTGKVLFCDNEHGAGDVTFPEMWRLDEQAFINPVTTAQLRKAAKAAGWTREAGRDYCKMCSAAVVDDLN